MKSKIFTVAVCTAFLACLGVSFSAAQNEAPTVNAKKAVAKPMVIKVSKINPLAAPIKGTITAINGAVVIIKDSKGTIKTIDIEDALKLKGFAVGNKVILKKGILSRDISSAVGEVNQTAPQIKQGNTQPQNPQPGTPAPQNK